MKTKKILHIAHEICPYITNSTASQTELDVIQSIVDNGGEIRVFMPKWGNINERRNQLHEVIRLSGMNIVIDDTDHPLIIKVASIQSARTQVYFIDNEDYFTRRLMAYDEENKPYADNAERAVFYARGVLETVKKLRWNPDIIHCHGWASTVAVMFLKTAYRDLPQFENAKIVFSAYDDMLTGIDVADFSRALYYNEVDETLVKGLGLDYTKTDALTQIALNFADGLILGGEHVDASIIAYAEEKKLPILPYQTKENMGAAYGEFYNSISGS